jgi:hypothetical protein
MRSILMLAAMLMVGMRGVAHAAACTRFPACILVTHGVPFGATPNGGNVQNPGITLEQPPAFSATQSNNYQCCSVVYPPRICVYQSATCVYIENY